MTIQLAGTSYNGSPAAPSNPFPPTKITQKPIKAGRTLIAANGTRTFVSRSSTKREWSLTWDDANGTTRTAVAAVAALTTTFTFVDEIGSSWTVQTESEDYQQETAFTAGDGTIYFSLSLTLHQA